jgi:hypothetical protein
MWEMKKKVQPTPFILSDNKQLTQTPQTACSLPSSLVLSVTNFRIKYYEVASELLLLSHAHILAF